MAEEASPGTPGRALVMVGMLIAVVGLLGTALLLSDMGGGGAVGDSTEYSSVDKWLAALAGTSVAALGVIAVGIGEVVAKLSRNED